MKTKHEKSGCCKSTVVKYGAKRKQCVVCKKTWRVWRKKRGRKKKRVDQNLVRAFLGREIPSLAFVARKRGFSEALLQKRLKKSKDQFIARTTWPDIPKGDLILIADAVVERIEHKWTATYLLLVRATKGHEAVILPPLIRDGTEISLGWREATNTISKSILPRIKAIVCDGHRGLLSEALWRGWIVQRCQFHLLARIQSRRSRFRIARHRDEAEAISKHTQYILKHPIEQELRKSLNSLEEIGWHSKSPEIQKVLSGFVRNYQDYRSFLTHPELNLPTTSNTAECLASTIADLKRRMRGFRTRDSFCSWIIALLKFKRKIKCNGYQPN